MTSDKAATAIVQIKTEFLKVLQNKRAELGDNYHAYEGLYAALELAAEIVGTNVDLFAQACGEVASVRWGYEPTGPEQKQVTQSSIIIKA